MWLAVFYLRYQPRSPEAEFPHSLREQRQLRKNFLYDDRNSSYICKKHRTTLPPIYLSGGGSHELLFLTIRDIPQLDQNTGHARFAKHQKTSLSYATVYPLTSPERFLYLGSQTNTLLHMLILHKLEMIYDSEEFGSNPSYRC